jgi:hypothetical protein
VLSNWTTGDQKALSWCPCITGFWYVMIVVKRCFDKSLMTSWMIPISEECGTPWIVLDRPFVAITRRRHWCISSLAVGLFPVLLRLFCWAAASGLKVWIFCVYIICYCCPIATTYVFSGAIKWKRLRVDNITDDEPQLPVLERPHNDHITISCVNTSLYGVICYLYNSSCIAVYQNIYLNDRISFTPVLKDKNVCLYYLL